jgi:hypothetical protein
MDQIIFTDSKGKEKMKLVGNELVINEPKSKEEKEEKNESNKSQVLRKD